MGAGLRHEAGPLKFAERDYMSDLKAYIGDGVYVDFNNAGQLILTTEDGISITNTIFLENEVYAALLSYVKQLPSRLAKRV